MRSLVLILLAGCVAVPARFVRADYPGRPCPEACALGEISCIDAAPEPQGYFLLGPFVIGQGDGPTHKALKTCEVFNRICVNRCAETANTKPYEVATPDGGWID